MAARTGEQSIIGFFPAWPKDWDAAFTLLARGAFVVTSSQQPGKVEFVELLSQAGEQCQSHNPWGEREVTMYHNGKKSENLSGALLKFDTRKGEDILVVPGDMRPAKLKRTML